MMSKLFHLFAFLVCVALCTPQASAVVLFSDNFNTDTSPLWTSNAAPAANAGLQQATFAYDYSAMGIPAAPGGGDTLGLRLRANIPGGAASPNTDRPAGVVSGLSLSPTGKTFGTSYVATFYAWTNFNGAANASGLADNANSEGGTQNVLFAIGTAGTSPAVIGSATVASGGAMDGVGFVTTGDGGITNDYRVFAASTTLAPTTTLAANSYANTNAYYNAIPSLAAHAAPPVQQTLSTAEYGLDAMNTQAGSTQPGSFGFAWHKVVLTKNGNSVTWDIDDTRIATVDSTALTLGGSNIAVGVSDINSTTTRHPSLVFTVFDNLVVTDVPAGLAGDFNSDGKVDAGDYDTWRKNNGTSNALANDNGLGVPVGLSHYALWRTNFGKPPGAGAGLEGSAVPEPSSLLLLMLSACFVVARRSRA